LALAAPGDLDGDGYVTLNDSKIALRLVGGLAKGTEVLVASADVSSDSGAPVPDGAVSLADIIRITRAASKLDILSASAGTYPLPISSAVTISGDAARNFALPGGFKVSGIVKDSAGVNVRGNIKFRSHSNGALTVSELVRIGTTNTGRFTAILPAGTYDVTIQPRTQVVSPDFSSFYTSFYDVPLSSPLVVSADSDQSFVQPALPATGVVTGTVTPATFVQSDAYLYASPGSAVGDARFLGVGTATGQTYNGKAQAGTFYLWLEGYNAQDGNNYIDYIPDDPITVIAGGTTTRNVDLPAFVQVSGKVTAPEGTTTAGVSLSPQGPFPWTTAYPVQSYYDYSQGADTRAYRLAVCPQAYDLDASISSVTVESSTLDYTFHQPLQVGAADMVKDITFDPLPPNRHLSGTVTGPGGAVVAGAMVYALTVYPNTSGSYYVGSTTYTGADGAYHLTLPDGQYTLTITPPS
jgi:hypothetical protein